MPGEQGAGRYDHHVERRAALSAARRRGGGFLRVLAALTLLAATACAGPHSPAAVPGPTGTGTGYRVLVFSRTAGFRHDSIPAGIEAVRALGARHGFAVTATEDPGAFTATNLSRYRAVVFLNTTGNLLDPGQRTAFEGYIRHGGGFVGVHSAADTGYDWPFYGGLLGTYFASHPAVQRATVRVPDRTHPATAGLGATWVRTDEWYNFRTDPRPHVHVLATVDESSYRGGAMGADHPVAWCQAYQGGRSFYTALGHTIASYSEPAFLAHLLGGIRYAAGTVGDPTGCAPSRPATAPTP